MMLGDVVAKALALLGITPERVERWSGQGCRCKDRQARLNSLSAWAWRVLGGKTENAEKYLEQLIKEQ